MVYWKENSCITTRVLVESSSQSRNKHWLKKESIGTRYCIHALERWCGQEWTNKCAAAAFERERNTEEEEEESCG